MCFVEYNSVKLETEYLPFLIGVYLGLPSDSLILEAVSIVRVWSEGARNFIEARDPKTR